ncbi:MAG: ABC transporter permease, partial [Candidatus Aenigmatarchaeota archaeon]
MLDLAFRNIMRQKTRTTLTAMGILIGIGAIIALGSVSEGIRIMVQDELSIISGKVTVYQKGTDIMTNPFASDITDEQLGELEQLSGVDEVVPMIFYMERTGGPLNIPDWYAIGVRPSQIPTFVGQNVLLEDGQMLEEGDTDSVLIGKDVSENLNYVVGDVISFQESDYTIIGVFERTEVSDIDLAVMFPLEELQDVLDKDTVQMAYVIPDNPAEAESITESLKSNIEGLDAISDKDIARMAEDIVSTISLFTFSIGAIAAFVGGLSIMNTMIMSVMERKREIGTMKAMGATSWSILRQIVTESAMISMIGAVGGIAVGSLGALAIGMAAGGQLTVVISPG